MFIRFGCCGAYAGRRGLEERIAFGINIIGVEGAQLVYQEVGGWTRDVAGKKCKKQ